MNEQNGFTFFVPDEEVEGGMDLSSPASRRGQLSMRQAGRVPSTASPEAQAVRETSDLMELVIGKRQELTQAAVETKAELALHNSMVFAEAISHIVDLKDSFSNLEKRKLLLNHLQQMLNRLPDALMRGFEIADQEINDVIGTDLSTLLASPQLQEEEILEHIDVTLGDWWRGGKWVTRTVPKKKRR